MDLESQNTLFYIYSGYTFLLLVVISLAVLLLAILVYILRRVNRTVMTIKKTIKAEEEVSTTGVYHVTTKFTEEKSMTEGTAEREREMPDIVITETNRAGDGNSSDTIPLLTLAEVEVRKFDQQSDSSGETLDQEVTKDKGEKAIVDENLNSGLSSDSKKEAEQENTVGATALIISEGTSQEKKDHDQNITKKTEEADEKSKRDEYLERLLSDMKVETSGTVPTDRNVENAGAQENALLSETLKAKEKKETTKEEKPDESTETTNSGDKEKDAIEKLTAVKNEEQKTTFGKSLSPDISPDAKTGTLL